MSAITDDKQEVAKIANGTAPAGKAERAIGKVAERQAFALWLFDPNRSPRSQKDWARQNGVSEATCSDWKKTAPEVLAAAQAYRNSPAIAVGYAESLRRMIEEAKGGKVNAFRAVSDVLGTMAPLKVDTSWNLADAISGKYDRGGPPVPEPVNRAFQANTPPSNSKLS